ncbi:RBPJ-interacting and tubulin-associated protein 1 [Thamnophis elegans]|uniref:RBPJ-interacting and tubulin-associated protein 1 n=1 Tax=Thamnophis elegans TaxID=35005 RepID=UPI0013769CBB|nr:RBPJ-interacting and tubulin-associated protein 1 [Thamnophis elegans]XP_032085851.1 RBPJ-interacting and tubulin-associated protein 1 [Thamnophis elegans]XP_032085852.1 RBPJ-interacting and tubulin-associated protein 1 [Thamnophis elegans]
MKASAGLGAPSQRKGRVYRIKATASFVDESLFGNQGKHQPSGPEFEPPWKEAKTHGQRPLLWSPEARRVDSSPLKSPQSVSTPRKRSKYRLKSHTPSYCDETLFGSKPGGHGWTASWATREDVAKLRPLLWTPPSAPRDRPVLSHRPPKEVVASTGNGRFEANHKAGTSAWKPPENPSDGATRRPPSQSLTRLYDSSDRFCPGRSHKQQDQRTPTASSGVLLTPRWKALPGASARTTGSQPEKPPWR